jgi:hypothetical protein
MTGPTRRTLLKHASLGAAAAAAAPVLLTGSADADTEHDGPTAPGAVMAYVRNQRTGEIAVMAGETEIICHDRALATHLARIAHRATQS